MPLPEILKGWIRKPNLGLSGRLLILTILFATIAEILIYIPALSYYRRALLNDRISAAHIAALVMDVSSGKQLSPENEMEVLHGVGVKYLAFERNGVRNLLAEGTINPHISKVVDLRDSSWNEMLYGALDDLWGGKSGSSRIIGNAPGMSSVEIIIERRPLQRELIAFSKIFLGYSIFTSLVTAGLLYWALQWIIVAPVLRLSRSITHFAQSPEDTTRIIKISGRGDEIGLAEDALEKMERSLAEELRKKRHLAELGLAVSKINHELRNIFTTAQLLADRLENVPDDLVQRTVPRLVSVLDRAIAFCEATLAFGRVQEEEPKREVFPVLDILNDSEELAGFPTGKEIRISIDVAKDIVVDADREQLTRVIANIMRNSFQALSEANVSQKEIKIMAAKAAQATSITIEDNGVGVPEIIRKNLFKPFQSSKAGQAKNAGSGLGLAIAAEIIELHGGSIVLNEVEQGASFTITIPFRADFLKV
ncbi:HAMP domain-containing sensor histidine kinase [Microvirga sp. W0021]|uniref:histidine kinase n=1 Tax=Hohaiivirga grylli TaxID=3133970 RepID=A0ABV0BM40_9HYPH